MTFRSIGSHDESQGDTALSTTQLANQSSQATIAQFERYVIPNYRRYPVCLVRGEGSWIWDAEGNRYLDFFPGWGCNLLGHCPPRVVEAVRDQVGQLIHVPNTWYMEAQGALAEALAERSFGGQSFFCNSGAEANEAAIKLARAFGHEQGRFKIVTMEGGFHGRTYAALTATAQPKYHVGLRADGARLRLRSLQRSRRGRRGARRPDGRGPGRARSRARGASTSRRPVISPGLRRLCDERGVLLILDEVQTGMGRTGEWFAYQHEGVVPDILTCAKALAGGIAAGVMMARPAVAAVLKPGMHASTFGGNPIACRAALAAIETIEADGLLERGVAIGARFREQFEALRAELPEPGPRHPHPGHHDRARLDRSMPRTSSPSA